MRSVSSLDSSLGSSGISKGGRKVGLVRSYVRLFTVKSELKVIGGAAKLLAADGNALNGYRETNVLSKVCACYEVSGDIYGRNGLDGGIDDFGNATLDLLHAGVGSSGTGNTNGHTNLNAKVSNGVSNVDLIDVVTAGGVSISKEEVVSGVASCLRVDSNYDTLNNKGIIGLSCKVLFMSIYLELRNVVAVLSGEGLTLLVGYSELKGVGDVSVGLICGNLYGYSEAVLAALKSYLVVCNGNSPINLVVLVLNPYRTYEIVVSASCGSNVLGKVVYEIVSSLEIRVRCGSGGLRCRIVGGFVLITCYKAENERQNEKKNKNSFHDSSFSLNKIG